MEAFEKFFQKRFTADNAKEAYLLACKWIATNIISSDLGKTFWNLSKIKEDAESATFQLELYCSLDEKEFVDRFCKMCKETHSSFYINEEYNCFRCNMITYRQRVFEALVIKKQYRKQRLKQILE